MNIESHFFIGRLVYNRVQEVVPVKLSKANFVSANILADYSTLVWEEPQFYLKSWNFIEDYIDYVANGVTNGRSFKLMPSISYHLGIITHYITDYFTHAHIGEGINGPRHHLQYEDFVDNYRLSIRGDLIAKDYLSLVDDVESTKDIKFELKSALEAYRKLPASPDVDLNMAISSSIKVCINLMQLRLEKLSAKQSRRTRELDLSKSQIYVYNRTENLATAKIMKQGDLR